MYMALWDEEWLLEPLFDSFVRPMTKMATLFSRPINRSLHTSLRGPVIQ